MTARRHSGVETRKDCPHVWVVEAVLSMGYLEPIQLLHAVELVMQSSLVAIRVLQLLEQGLLNTVQGFLKAVVSQLVLLNHRCALVEYLPQGLLLYSETSLDRRQEFDHHIFHELSLEILQL